MKTIMQGPGSRRGMAGRWSVSQLAVGVLVFALTPAAGAATGEEGVTRDDDPPEAVTFARDIAPILQENCQVCHQPGSIGPMSLVTYDQVRPWAPLIREQVVRREMPPYHYDVDVGIQLLKDDMRLSEAEIDAIVAWVDAGAPMGDPADLPPAMEWPDAAEWRYAPQFGQPDIVIRSTPYTVPASGNDLWWRPVVPTGITEERCIRAIEVKPSVEGRTVTHHANSTFQVQNEDGEWVDSARLTEFAIGKKGEIVPDGACRIAPPNSTVTWDIHYYPMGEEVQDNIVEIGLWLYPPEFDPSSLYQQTLRSYSLDGDLDIPPNGTAMTQGMHSFDHPVRIDSFQAHMHLRGRAKSLEVYYPETGQREFVSMISNFNAGWNISHVYEDDVAPLLPAGAVMILTAWYDNTADNPLNPDPNVWVGRGSRTTDEMSHAWIAITHLDQEGYERLVAEREARQRLTSDE